MGTITKKAVESAKRTLELYKKQVLREYEYILNLEPLYDENVTISDCPKMTNRVRNILCADTKYGGFGFNMDTKLSQLSEISMSDFLSKRNVGKKYLNDLINILAPINVIMKK